MLRKGKEKEKKRRKKGKVRGTRRGERENRGKNKRTKIHIQVQSLGKEKRTDMTECKTWVWKMNGRLYTKWIIKGR